MCQYIILRTSEGLKVTSLKMSVVKVHVDKLYHLAAICVFT